MALSIRGNLELPEEILNEGNPDARNICDLSNYLEKIGMHIHIAENGFEATDFLKRNSAVKIVLMDMMMPEMDMKQLRK